MDVAQGPFRNVLIGSNAVRNHVKSWAGLVLLVTISVAESEDRIFIGRGPNGYYQGPDEPFLGLAVMRDGEVVHNLNVLEGN